ncbi:MAG: hypothetical protein AVDCRST_MAG88-1487, partial [uncultured Thermomicrobiales bacterium]
WRAIIATAASRRRSISRCGREGCPRAYSPPPRCWRATTRSCRARPTGSCGWRRRGPRISSSWSGRGSRRTRSGRTSRSAP